MTELVWMMCVDLLMKENLMDSDGGRKGNPSVRCCLRRYRSSNANVDEGFGKKTWDLLKATKAHTHYYFCGCCCYYCSTESGRSRSWRVDNHMLPTATKEARKGMLVYYSQRCCPFAFLPLWEWRLGR